MTLAAGVDGTLVALRIGVPIGLLAFALIALRSGRRATVELEESMILPPVRPSRAGTSQATRSVLLRTPQGPRRIEVTSPLVIGRDPNVELSLEHDRFASARHAVLERRGDDLWLTDLGSTNGTFVGGEPVQTRRLRPGDVVLVGETELEVAP
ncbi:MAG: FHA domain-containing protein [Gaiella sp.]